MIALVIGGFAHAELPLPQLVVKDALVARLLNIEYGGEARGYVGWDASESFLKLPIKIYGFRGKGEASSKNVFFIKLDNNPTYMYVNRDIEFLSEICSSIRPAQANEAQKFNLINLMNFLRFGPDSTLLDEMSKKMLLSRGADKESRDVIEGALKNTGIDSAGDKTNLRFFRIDETGTVWKITIVFNKKWEIEEFTEQVHGKRNFLIGYIR